MPSPIFIVGFPRSGTTLLDQILDSHPALQTIEEKPLVRAVLHERWPDPEDMAHALATLTEAEAAGLRQEYYALAEAFQPIDADKRLVDKFPLNIVRLPAIQRIFPDAKFILALRHPCDVCLSCYMQMFSPNHAMANFLDLGDTANLYARVMKTGLHHQAILKPDCHAIKYEDLVRDFEGETRRLLAFLGLEWHEGLRNFSAHAKTRSRINTPSYHQVAEPIYQRAAFRWQRYGRYFEPHLATLEPCMTAWGYSA